MMNVGQRVLLVATWQEDACVPPPIGAVGEVRSAKDRDGDYYVLFPEYPCPVDDEPEWFTPAWAIIPIDDPPSSRATRAALELEQK